MVLNGTAGSAYDIHEIASQCGRHVLPPYPSTHEFSNNVWRVVFHMLAVITAGMWKSTKCANQACECTRRCNEVLCLTFVGPCIVIYFCSKTNQMHNISNLFYFWNSTVRASDGLSVHHQESKTVYTASSICHTGSVVCLLAGTWCPSSVPLASRQQNLYDIYLMLCVQS